MPATGNAGDVVILGISPRDTRMSNGAKTCQYRFPWRHCRKSERLLTLGARVHVVSGATRAMAVVRAKRLDIALIGPAPEGAPAALKRTFDEYAVPYVITATSRTSEPNYERIFSLSLRGISDSPDVRS